MRCIEVSVFCIIFYRYNQIQSIFSSKLGSSCSTSWTLYSQGFGDQLILNTLLQKNELILCLCNRFLCFLQLYRLFMYTSSISSSNYIFESHLVRVLMIYCSKGHQLVETTQYFFHFLVIFRRFIDTGVIRQPIASKFTNRLLSKEKPIN